MIYRSMEDFSSSCGSCRIKCRTYGNLWTHNKSHHNGINAVKASSSYDDELYNANIVHHSYYATC